MNIVRQYAPAVEKYSIDECFADMPGMHRIYCDSRLTLMPTTMTPTEQCTRWATIYSILVAIFHFSNIFKYIGRVNGGGCLTKEAAPKNFQSPALAQSRALAYY